MKCTDCNGMGKIIITRIVPFLSPDRAWHSETIKCISCNGTGIIQDYSKPIHIENLKENINRLEEYL